MTKTAPSSRRTIKKQRLDPLRIQVSLRAEKPKFMTPLGNIFPYLGDEFTHTRHRLSDRLIPNQYRTLERHSPHRRFLEQSVTHSLKPADYGRNAGAIAKRGVCGAGAENVITGATCSPKRSRPSPHTSLIWKLAYEVLQKALCSKQAVNVLGQIIDLFVHALEGCLRQFDLRIADLAPLKIDLLSGERIRDRCSRNRHDPSNHCNDDAERVACFHFVSCRPDWPPQTRPRHKSPDRQQRRGRRHAAVALKIHRTLPRNARKGSTGATVTERGSASDR